MAQVSEMTPRSDRDRANAAARRNLREVERPLAPAELFFSTTDLKGIMTSANRVFERISGYPLDALVGANHNLIRHPEMPRAVFQLLWDTVQDGRPIAAYVKNLAADGSFYWVLATVVPITDGYLSVRLAPGSEHFEAARSVYKELLALEREIEGGDVRRRKAAITASVARLGELLPAAGFADYEAFMRSALPAEVARRTSVVGPEHHRSLAAAPPDAPTALVEILAAYESMSTFLTGLVADLARYAQVGHALEDHSTFLSAMGDKVRLFALNAQIGASRLGREGVALDVVARLLTAQSQATSPLVVTVADGAAGAVREIEDMTFQLALSTIQAEMIAVFAHEIADHVDADDTGAAKMVSLADALQRGSRRTFGSFGSTADQLCRVLQQVDRVATNVNRLARLALNGRVELATIDDAGSISSLFTDVEKQVHEARGRLAEFAAIRRTADDLKAAARNPAMDAASRVMTNAALLAGV